MLDILTRVGTYLQIVIKRLFDGSGHCGTSTDMHNEITEKSNQQGPLLPMLDGTLIKNTNAYYRECTKWPS